MTNCHCGHAEQPDVEGMFYSYGICVCDESEGEMTIEDEVRAIVGDNLLLLGLIHPDDQREGSK